MSSSTNADAFSFDTEFGVDGTVLQEGGRFKRYTQAEMDAAVEAARQEAMASSEAQMHRQVEASVQALVQHVSPTLPFAMSIADDLRKQAAELALMMGRKLAAEAIAAFPQEAVQAALAEAVSDLPMNAVVTLKISPDLEALVAPVVEARTPPGTDIRLVADPMAAPGAWTLEWASGAVSQDPEMLAEKLEQIVRSHLTQPLEPQGDLFATVA
ncbi:hypothetical protein [Ponticaulis sp.]|uniref:hypothetical protein n=1 Tax=Ponticaulis sp. TaxID=2020902 RepID=UPI0026301EFB|nr:hypothetical protein [Ponticaulis sp.]MDF1680058.1 hypothetical protein [Ponticaulis sp.]